MLKKYLIGTFAVAAFAFAITASAAYDFGTTTLKVGSKGEAVKTLQTLVGANADGNFGQMTKAKVMAWQANNGLTADGMFGNASKAKANMTAGTPTTSTCPTGYVATTPVAPLFASCVAAAGTPTTPTTPVVGGAEGDITTFSEVSSKDSTLEEGMTSELFAFTAEVDGDVSIDRVDFYLDSTAAGSHSNNADDYFKSASLMINGAKVATVDVKDFTEDNYAKVSSVTGDSNEYRVRFSGLKSVFADGAKPKFVLAFEALSSIDGTDIGEIWGVELVSDSVRFVDGRGFTSSVGAALSETFTGETQDVAKLSINTSSNDYEITTIKVSDTDDTKDQPVFKFNIEEENDVDATVEDMTLTATTVGTADESAVITSMDLYNGSTMLGSQSVSSSGVANFTDLGLKIEAGKTVELTVKLTFADNTAYTEGETVTVVVTSITDASDANGNDESDMTISGAGLSSKTHILRSKGISVAVKSATTTINAVDGATNDIAEFAWVFDVAAFGDKDVYINADNAGIVAATVAGNTSTLYSVEKSAGAVLGSLGGTIVESDSDVTTVTGVANASATDYYATESFFKINKGTTGTFTLTVTGTNATDAKQVRGLLNSIEWTTDVVTDAAVATETINSYTSNLGSDAATPFKSVN